MTHASATPCPSCGAAGTGRFCATCGAPRAGAPCAGCGTPVSPGARFCPGCGRGVGAPMRGAGDRTPWMIAGAAVVGLLAVLLFMLSRGPTPTAVAADGGGVSESGGLGDPAGTPPDISNMSPRERFNRLYNRVMRAAQGGDEATVTRFTPMALMAYAQLDTLDADARYHAALLQIHTGDAAGPTALADTILTQQPGHLFGYIIRATVARWQRDEPALAKAYAGFQEHYDAEMKAGRPEYEEHKISVDEFRQAAQRAKPARAGS